MRISSSKLAPFAPVRLANRESGVLLLEVMLAMMIFAVAAVGLASALDSTIDAYQEIRRESQVRIALQSLLAETRGQNMVAGRQDLQITGTPGVTYSREIKIYEAKNEKLETVTGIFEILIQARWLEGDRKMEREVQEYAYQSQ